MTNEASQAIKGGLRRLVTPRRACNLRFYVLYQRLKLVFNFTANRTPLARRSTAATASAQPFFIIGSGRSGSTLLRAILVSGNNVLIPPEIGVIGPLVLKWKVYNFLPWRELVKLTVSEFEAMGRFAETWNVCLSPIYYKLSTTPKQDQSLSIIVREIYNHYAASRGIDYVIWGDKTPGNTDYLEWINMLFPDAKYIHMIRDGRDVCASLYKSGLQPDLDSSAKEWSARVKEATRFGKLVAGPTRYMEVRYEDLVSQPEGIIRDVCAFLGIAFSDEMLRPEEGFAELGDASVHPHHSNLMNSINKKSIGKWRDSLSQVEQEELKKLLPADLRETGLGHE